MRNRARGAALNNPEHRRRHLLGLNWRKTLVLAVGKQDR
jgi:hypothetical protein